MRFTMYRVKNKQMPRSILIKLRELLSADIFSMRDENMKNYRHKPTIITAVQFKHNQKLEDGHTEWQEQHGDPYFYAPTKMESAYIFTYDDTFNGYPLDKKKTLINVGDWIVIDKKKKYVISEKEFKRCYEKIEDDV